MNWLTKYAGDPALAEFAIVPAAGARVLVRRGYESAMVGLNGAVRNDTLEIVARTGGGRQAHPIARLPSGERIVVREYRRGGAIRHINRARYFAGNRALEELRTTVIAQSRGVRVPRMIAAIERPARFGYTAMVAVGFLDGVVDLATWLVRDRMDRSEVMRSVGFEVGRMHQAAIAHPDLNLRNLLVSASSPDALAVTIIDFDRARVFENPIPLDRRRKDLLRLARSARKLRAPIDTADWEAFRDGYGDGWPLLAPLG